MKKILSLIGIGSVVFLFSSCLKDEGVYNCPLNKRTYLSMNIDGTNITPDDYASGAVVYMNEGDTAARTVVEMSLFKGDQPYVLFIQMDSTVFEGITFNNDSVKSAYVSLENVKSMMHIDNVHFSELNGSVPSNYENLFYYENAKGTFSGKILKPGSTDSSVVTGTFCYDDSPSK